MGKKKKKGKGKAKGGGSADGLPPPPQFSENREGAIEAMLNFRIKGTEESIDMYTEETDEYKDKNWQQFSKNHQVKSEKQVYLKKLLREAKELSDKLKATETVSRGDVEQAMMDKLSCMADLEQEILQLQLRIEEIDTELEALQKERDRIQKFKEETQFENKEHIAEMKLAMDRWKEEEKEIQTSLATQLEICKHRVEQQMVKMSERQRERTSEWLLKTMDGETTAEIADNLWLKDQIQGLKTTESNLKEQIDRLEGRNLQLMTSMYRERKEQLEASCRLFSRGNRSATPMRESLTSMSQSSSKTHLTRSKTQVTSRPIDVGLLSIEGLKFPVISSPTYVSLPPIEEQKNQTLQFRPSWPVTNKMLKSAIT